MKRIAALLLCLFPSCASILPQTFEPLMASQEARVAPEWWGGDFLAVGAVLSVETPLDAPLVLQIVRLKGAWGQSWWNPRTGRYHIQLDPRIPSFDWAVYMLAHEWAHCLVAGAAGAKAHGPLWGVAFARCYRAAVDPGVQTPEKPEPVQALPGAPERRPGEGRCGG